MLVQGPLVLEGAFVLALALPELGLALDEVGGVRATARRWVPDRLDVPVLALVAWTDSG